MSKYIIEINPEYEDKFRGVMILGAENSNLYVDSQTVDELEELTSDYINEHFPTLLQDEYDRGYKDGRNVTETQAHDDAYQRGFEDGKAVNDKGCEGCKYANVAGTHEPCVRCSNSYGNQWTAKDDKIEVGDEVYFKGDNTSDSGVVTWVGKNNVCIMWRDGSAGENPKDKLLKTGRHFDIASILEDMRND